MTPFSLTHHLSHRDEEGAMTAVLHEQRIPTGPRMFGEPELWGAIESAECLGVSQPNLRTVKGLPEPYDKVRATTLWRADEVRRLAAERASRKAA